MKRYSIFHALYLSFFSNGLYQDVRKNWKGTVFLYLLVLLALTWLPVMVSVHAGLSDFVENEAPKYVNQIPKITITRGEVSLDRPAPYAIIDPDTSAPLIVIDPSGKIASLDQTLAPALLTKTKFMMRQRHRAETRIYDLSQIENLTIEREQVNGWVQAFKKWFAFVAYPFALAFSYAYRIIQVLLYAAIGMLFARLLKASLDYMDVVRLAAVAITPVIILTTVRTLWGFHVPYFWPLCFLAAIGYLFFAVKANAGKGPE